MKKELTFTLTGIILFVLFTGCGGDNQKPSSTTQVSATDGVAEYITTNIAINDDCGTFTPFGRGGSGRHSVRTLMYEKLIFTNNDTLVIENWLAKEIINKGEGVYEVTIWDYITDSLGNKMTASDIVFSFDKAIEDGNATANLRPLSRYTATGPYSVEFVFASLNVGVFEQAMNVVYCITEAGWNASGDKMTATPYGTGPYVLGDYAKDSYYTFKKRDDYWQKDLSLRASIAAANADEITLRLILDTPVRTIALERGEIDASEVSADNLGNFLNSDGTPKTGFIHEMQKTGQHFALWYTSAAPSPLADLNLRKAISYAIDTEAIARLIHGNHARIPGSIINDAWLDSGAVDHDHNNYYGYNVESAKQYLKLSDYNGETLKLMSDSQWNREVTMIAAYCEEIGVKVELILLDKAIADEYALDSKPGRFDMFFTYSSSMFYSWSALGRFDANNYTSGLNRVFVNDPVLQELYKNISDSTKHSFQAVAEFGKYVEEQCYAYAIYSYNVDFIGRSDVFERLGFEPFRNPCGSNSVYVK
jgi:ABC-type transport system substrate-binding protein